MNEADRIRESIRRMRHKNVEPETVYMCSALYRKLWKPRKFDGVFVECDSLMKDGWLVR